MKPEPESAMKRDPIQQLGNRREAAMTNLETRALTARHVMTENLLTVYEDMTVRELADFLLENEISGAVVRDGDGRASGVVTATDIAAHAGDATRVEQRPTSPLYYMRGWDEIREASESVGWQIENVDLMVRDIMNHTIYAVDEETPLPEVARQMLESHIHRILVTRDGDLIGILTTSDFLRLYAAETVPITA